MRFARLCVVGCGVLGACNSAEGDVVGKSAGGGPGASTASAPPSAVGSAQSSASETASPVTSTAPTALNPLTSASIEPPRAEASTPTDGGPPEPPPTSLSTDASAPVDDAELYHPLWVPRAFGPVLDAYVDSVVSYVATLCRTGFCDDTPSIVKGCVDVEYQNFGHSPEWLACAARLPPAVTEDYFRAIASRFDALTDSTVGCGLALPPLDPHYPPPELAVCDALDGWMRGDDDAGVIVRRCDGSTERADGADERNCDPTAAEYDCGDGSGAPWLTWCDATEDCGNGADEAACGR
jgi:hypothetical protein